MKGKIALHGNYNKRDWSKRIKKPKFFNKWPRERRCGICNVCNDLAAQKVEAVIAWLDEQYEANKTCEHDGAYEELKGIKTCFKCHVMFI